MIERNLKFISAGFLLLLLRIFLGRLVGIWFWSIMYHDDALFIRYADFYNHFVTQELPFNDSLLKDMGFPLFLNLVHWSGLQYTDCLALIWFCAAVTSVILFNKLTNVTNKKILFAIFAFVLFQPIAFDDWLGTRLYRNAALTPFYFLTLNLMVILFIWNFNDSKINLKKFFLYQIIFGLIFTLTFYMKEDGIWILACFIFVFIVCLIKILIQNSPSLKDKLFGVLILSIPLVILFGGSVFYKSMNYKYFGVNEINVRTEGEIGKFIKLIYKIKSDNKNGRIWAPTDAILKAFDASETLRNSPDLREAFLHSGWFGGDIVKNPIPGDFLTWVTLSAVKDFGKIKTYAEQEVFFKKVNAELEQAFDNGTLPRDNRFQLVSSMGGRTFDETLSLIEPTLESYLMCITMYKCRASNRFEVTENNALVMKASELTNMKLDMKNSHPKLSHIVATGLFIIYGILQGILFCCAVVGNLIVFTKFLRRKINFNGKEFLILIISSGYLVLTFVYIVAISWFTEFLGFGIEMFKYEMAVFPMLMTFEILGTHLLVSNYLNQKLLSNFWE